MTRIYLDTSAYNRPFDDQSQPKIFLETQSVTMILQMVEFGTVDLVGSSVLEYENSRNSDRTRQTAMARYLQLAKHRQLVNEAIRQRAKELGDNGVKQIDALHVACAEAANSEYFITCDKRLINRCANLTMSVVNPIDFMLEASSNDSSEA